MPNLLTGPGAIPTAPGGWPLLGHVVPLLTTPLAFVNSLPSLGNLVQIRLGPMKAVVVCDPELTRQVLVHDQVFDKGGPMYERARELGGDGLGTCPHSRHRRQRRLTQPAFHHTRLPAYARTMTEQIEHGHRRMARRPGPRRARRDASANDAGDARHDVFHVADRRGPPAVHQRHGHLR